MQNISVGQLTSTVYEYICMKKYLDAIIVLSNQLLSHSNSRAALSLLAFCYAKTSQYRQASVVYEQLTKLYPNNPTYRLQYASCLHRVGYHDEALKATFCTEALLHDEHCVINGIGALKLGFSICFHLDDMKGASAFVQPSLFSYPEIIVNAGCLHYRENNYRKACSLFSRATSVNSVILINYYFTWTKIHLT